MIEGAESITCLSLGDSRRATLVLVLNDVKDLEYLGRHGGREDGIEVLLKQVALSVLIKQIEDGPLENTTIQVPK